MQIHFTVSINFNYAAVFDTINYTFQLTACVGIAELALRCLTFYLTDIIVCVKLIYSVISSPPAKYASYLSTTKTLLKILTCWTIKKETSKWIIMIIYIRNKLKKTILWDFRTEYNLYHFHVPSLWSIHV